MSLRGHGGGGDEILRGVAFQRQQRHLCSHLSAPPEQGSFDAAGNGGGLLLQQRLRVRGAAEGDEPAEHRALARALAIVVRRIQYSPGGVAVFTEDGWFYKEDYVLVSVSIGVLQTKLIKFEPVLPNWKILAIYQFDMSRFLHHQAVVRAIAQGLNSRDSPAPSAQ